MTKQEIARARATIDALRARYGKGKTKLTDDQIAEGLEHYRPKGKVDVVVLDELRGDAE
ncbi:MAG: hypothetical protein IJI68_00620 [Eggerthellaceae bacterium]|nr:hypothetical protein [Eggerthellaceae bacterium]